MNKVVEETYKQFEEFFKKQIEKLRESTKELDKVVDFLSTELIEDISCPIEEVAYSLLSEIRNVGGDEQDTIRNEFTDYLYGKKYKTLDDFLKWLEEV